MAAVLYPTSNLNAFTTTAGTEAAVAIIYLPVIDASGGFVIGGQVNFTAVNAATTALAVRVRQATFAAGHVVVSSPAGTQIGTTSLATFTAGTLSTASLPFFGTDGAPVEVASSDAALPAQVASLSNPGTIPQGGFLYVVTVTSTTNVATVAAGAAAGFALEVSGSQ